MSEQVRIKGRTGEGDRFLPQEQVLAGLIKLLGEGRVDDAVTIYVRCAVDIGYPLISKVAGDPELQRLVANMLYRARDFAKAAMVCEALEENEKAAALYEKAGDYAMAAEMYARAGNKLKSAEMYERGGNLSVAASLYADCGLPERAARCYQRVPDAFAAGKLFFASHKDKQAVELLQKVEEEDPNYPEAVVLLAQLLARNGYAELAEKKLRAAIAGREIDDSNVGVYYALGDLYARLGATEKAKEAFEAVLGHDFNYADAKARLDRLNAGGEEEHLPRSDLAADAQAEGVGDVAVGETASAEVVGMDPGLAFLKELDLFEDMSLDDLRALASVAEARSYQPGEVLIEQGAPSEAFFVLTEGTVEVKRVDGSTETRFATLPAGAHVGEMSLIDEAPTSARVVAAEPTRALALPTERFKELLGSRPALALKFYQAMATTLSRRLRATNAKIKP